MQENKTDSEMTQASTDSSSVMSMKGEKCDHCDDCRGGNCCSTCMDKYSCTACGGKDCSGCGKKSKCWCGRSNCSCGKLIWLVIGVGIGILLGVFVLANRQSMPKHNNETVEGMMTVMAQSLNGLSGNELDKAFLEGMIAHHQGAVLMASEVAARSDRPELQKMSADIITTQSAEIDQMQQWHEKWFE